MRTRHSFLAIALVVTLATTGQAAAEWSEPVLLSSTGGTNTYADAVVDSLGQITVGWRHNVLGGDRRVFARRISPDGTLGPLLKLAAPRKLGQVAVAKRGEDVVVMWGPAPLHYVWIAPNGTVGPTQSIPVPRLGNNWGDLKLDVAFDPGGIATIVLYDWNVNTDQGVVRAVRFHPDGSAGNTVTLSPNQGSAHWPSMAVGADGVTTVAWLLTEGGQCRLQARQLRADDSRGPLHDLSAPMARPEFLFRYPSSVAMNAKGDAYIAWWRDRGDRSAVEMRKLTRDGTLKPARRLSPRGADSVHPQAIADRSGKITVVWGGQRIYGRQIAADGTIGPVFDVSDTTGDAPFSGFGPVLASNDVDDVGVMWLRRGGSANFVEARTIAANGTLGPVASRDAMATDPRFPEVTLDASGRLGLFWHAVSGDFGWDILGVTGP